MGEVSDTRETSSDHEDNPSMIGGAYNRTNPLLYNYMTLGDSGTGVLVNGGDSWYSC